MKSRRKNYGARLDFVAQLVADEGAYCDEAFNHFGFFLLVLFFILILLDGSAANNARFEKLLVWFGPFVDREFSDFH